MNKLIKCILLPMVFVVMAFAIACSKEEAKGSPYLNIKEETLEIYVGATTQLTVEQNKIEGELQFFVDHPSILSVDEQGNITGISAGKTTVTVFADDFTDTCSVTVSKEGVAEENFPYIRVANDKITPSTGGKYFLYPALMIGTQEIDGIAFSVTVADGTVATAEITDHVVTVSGLKAAETQLTISAEYGGILVEKIISVNVLEDTEETVAGYMTVTGVCQVQIDGITGNVARVYVDDFRVDANVYPDSIGFALMEDELSVLHGKNVGDTLQITVLGDNGKVYFAGVKLLDVENYGGSVYVQTDGKIKGLSGYTAFEMLGRRFSVTEKNGAAYLDEANWQSVVDTLTVGNTFSGSIVLDEKVILIPMRYVTMAISTYQELTQMEAGALNYYCLTNDIDCTGNVWHAIGREAFQGVLDGQGYAIRGLTLENVNADNTWYNGYCDNTFNGTNSWQCKFISYVGEKGVVQNVVFDEVKGEDNLTKTPLIGVNQGLIENVVVSLAGIGIDGFSGLVGENEGVVQNCILDYTYHALWIKNYIAAVNKGRIDGVIVNETPHGSYPLLGTDTGTTSNCEGVSKSKADMLAYLPDGVMKDMYDTLSISAITLGAKSQIDFNGTSVMGYTVTLAKDGGFSVTEDYVADLKARDIVSVKVWIKIADTAANAVYIKETETGILGGLTTRNDWMYHTDWTALNIGRNYNEEGTSMVNAVVPQVFADTVLTPDDLTKFTMHAASTSTFYVYIEEFAANTVPVVSGKEYEASTAEVDGDTVVTYRVEFTANTSGTYDPNNGYAGFMISEGYLDYLASQGYTGITLMVKTDGLIQTAKGYQMGADNWQADWRNDTVLEDWTALVDTTDNLPYTLETAKDLHVQALSGNGLSQPTYVEFYIVAHS